MMQLGLFSSVWACGSWKAAQAFARAQDFHGIEGPTPKEAPDLPWIAEIATGGGYVPQAHPDPATHIEDFRRQFAAAHPFQPLMVTCLGGSDLWSADASVQFFGSAMEEAAHAGVPICFETHRSRSTFHPIPTMEILRQLPEMRLTCDFSHWVCVCEQPVLDVVPGLLALCAQHCGHVHLRVGHPQGPQVPDPSARHQRHLLDAHMRWWRVLVHTARARGRTLFTATPEFGPDGYGVTDPQSGKPMGSLEKCNTFVAAKFAACFSATSNPELSTTFPLSVIQK
jgi:sugar phosphate isomerase/epimerase